MEYVDHYLTGPGFVISRNGDIVVTELHPVGYSPNARPNWDGYVFNEWYHLDSSDIMQGESERRTHSANRDSMAKVTVKAHICISFDFCGQGLLFFSPFFFNGGGSNCESKRFTFLLVSLSAEAYCSFIELPEDKGVHTHRAMTSGANFFTVRRLTESFPLLVIDRTGSPGVLLLLIQGHAHSSI